MRELLLRGCAALVSFALVVPPAYPQTPAPAPPPAPGPSGSATSAAADVYSEEQLDALLAPIALYPDQLLAQVLMAATYPLDVVAASRWLESGNNKSLTGDALAKALATQSWDPSVKSIVPFPQVLAMMNQNLDWTQQLGFAVANQQNDVMGAVQRLRVQAQQAGMLKTTEQQVVTVNPAPSQGGAPPQQVIVIEPANPQVVYVPTYNPSVVFGTWPYATPPVYLPPPPGYAFGTALATGLAFAAGVAVVGSLWGWARPGWGYGGGYGGGWGGSINVNNNRYTNISNNNINRGTVNNGRWQASAAAPGRVPNRPPPNGPVGRPNRGNGLPPNAIGRPSVSVPGGAVNRPNIGQRPNGGPGGGPGGGANVGNRPNLPPAGGANRPGGGQGPTGGNRPNLPADGANRPAGGQGAGSAANRPNLPSGGANRPGGGQGAGAGNRPNPPSGGVNRPGGGQGAGGAANRPNLPSGGVNRPSSPPTINRPATRPSGGGAFGGMNDGARSGQFQQRGAQSRNVGARPSGGVQRGGGGGVQRGGGGGGPRGGGGGGRGGGGRR